MNDEDHMRRAIALAAAGLGQTGDNPSVGCVIVLDGAVVAEAATGAGGRPHAEETALNALGRPCPGAVAYVTLEPCAQRSAGGVSCTDRLIAAGAARVVVAARDPSPYATGQGLQRLHAAGIAVETGLLADEATALYRDYWTRFRA